MNHSVTRKTHPARRLLSCALASCLVLGAAPAFAQSTSATIRGQVLADSAPATQAQVTATNLATGLTRSVQSSASGSYSLAGLPPGTYRVDVESGGKRSSQNITVQVGQTATVNLGVGGVAETAGGAATTLDAVQVTAQSAVETRTSEIATYITNRQIEALPQGTRNVLAFADTVPGMQFTQDNSGFTSLRGGAQSANNINVFIDGVGQKNYVLQGGVSGQDTSSGNPFPQLAIGEYKVITSNYKAEFDQISSAAVVAVTKSGTNEFKGSFFWDKFTDSWRSKTLGERAGVPRTDFSEEHYGASWGGPILRDRLHFFVTYESKEQMRPYTMTPGRGYTPARLPAQFHDLLLPGSQLFNEDLYFGKLSWQPGDAHLVELTAKRRNEVAEISAGGSNSFEHGTDRKNTDDRLDLRYQLTFGDWLNDAHLTYEDTSWGPRPRSIGPGYILVDGGNWRDVVLQAGAGGDYQDKGQKGLALQDDLTFSGWQNHTLKMGFKYKDVDLSVTERAFYNPQFHYDATAGEFTVPYHVTFGGAFTGIGDGTLKTQAKQFGIYFQDDWQVSERLLLNLGLRWDYEQNPAYTDYQTPAATLAALNAVDPRGNGTQTYAQTLALGGIDLADYIATGSNRSDFKKAWQPRLGFSYDLSGDQRHVIFGGAGRSYDRNLFDWLSLERNKQSFPENELNFNTTAHPCAVGVGNCLAWNPAYLQPGALAALATATPGREITLLRNDLKSPYSDQFSIGIRDVFELWGQEWNSSVALSRVVSKDGFVYMLGNRNPDGSFHNTGTLSIPWGAGVPGNNSLILGMNGLQTRANSLLVSLEKPYTTASRWGATLAYTYTDAEENREFGEHYALHYPTLAGYGWSRAGGVPKHRLVLTGMGDVGFGITASGKLTLATPAPWYGTNCSAGWSVCDEQDQVMPDATLGYKSLDVALQKRWDTGTDLGLKVRLDVLNLFDWVNYNYPRWFRAPGDGDPRTTEQLLPTRTVKLSFGLDW